MIAELRVWMTSVVMVSLLLSLMQMLIPEGRLRKAASLMGGLLMMAALIQPLLELKEFSWESSSKGYISEIRETEEELKKTNEKQLADGIAGQLEAYIVDRAEQKGLRPTVRVRCACTEQGFSVLEVELNIVRDAELASWMERELGVPEERQVWA